MQITQFTDYSMRVLIYLSRRPAPGCATITEIADYYQISRNHLVKVANHLVNGGFIHSTRGKGGGIQLARPPAAIGMGEVLRYTESNMNLMECFDPAINQCRLARDCALKGMMYEARQSFMSVLDKYTLADSAKPLFNLGKHDDLMGNSSIN